MTSQSEVISQGELVGDIFYIADAGHRYLPGQRFRDYFSEATAILGSISASYWVALEPEGARKVLARSRGIGSSHHHQHADTLLTEYPDAHVHYVRHPWRDHPTSVETWMDYDWAVATERVNQWGYLPGWRSHVARFAHGFDALPGFESFNQLSAAQKSTAFRVGQTIGGHAWERLAFWLTYDAALSDDWKLPIVFDPVKKAVDAVCIECQSADGGLLLALSIDASAFAAKLAAGHVHMTNRTVNPWAPGDLLTVVPATTEDVTLETAISRLVHSFNSARDYYLKYVAHEVIAHDHD